MVEQQHRAPPLRVRIQHSRHHDYNEAVLLPSGQIIGGGNAPMAEAAKNLLEMGYGTDTVIEFIWSDRETPFATWRLSNLGRATQKSLEPA